MSTSLQFLNAPPRPRCLTMLDRYGDTDWPDTVDTSTMALFALILIGLPLLGYTFAVLDFRAYLRSLRRALVTISHFMPEMPEWARHETPPCLKALGLRAPCTEDDVKQAYRRLAQELHPDRGGDTRRFHILGEHMENALRFVREEQP